jgi:hypothetical protein
MNLDTLKSGQQITVHDAAIIQGQALKWSRTRGTRISISSHYVHPRVRDISINISGGPCYRATEWDPQLKALVRYGKATRIVGIDGPWREVRNPKHPQDAGKRLATPIQREGDQELQLP